MTSYQDYYRNLPTLTATARYTLLKDTGSGVWVTTSAGQAAEAVCDMFLDATAAGLTPAPIVAGELLMRGKIRILIATGAIAAYATVYTDVNGMITATNTGFKVGIALQAATALNDQIAVELDPKFVELFGVNTAQGTAVTGANVETILSTITLPAGSINLDDVFEFEAIVTSLLENSTDTHEYRVRLGGLTGTILADTGAIGTLAAPIGGYLRGSLAFFTLGAGAAGKVDGGGYSIFKATAAVIAAGLQNIDTTIAQTLVLTVQHGTNNVGNSSRLELFKAARKLAQ